MGRWVRRIATIVVAWVFLFSIIYIVLSMGEYDEADSIYADAASRFTRLPAAPAGGSADASGKKDLPPDAASPDAASPEEAAELAPITVDFSALLEVNGDIVGWIYCPGTNINYPVLHGKDNDVYLRRSYDGSYNNAGSIFVEAANSKGFADANTIIYGHHMEQGAEMFADLEEWDSQEFYEEHPVVWLLTPEQDYKIVLLSGYTTSAYSDAYQIFREGDCGLEEYMAGRMELSDFQAGTEPDQAARYVMLSTCAYDFNDARRVLHGMLVPVDSAAGVRKE